MFLCSSIVLDDNRLISIYFLCLGVLSLLVCHILGCHIFLRTTASCLFLRTTGCPGILLSPVDPYVLEIKHSFVKPTSTSVGRGWSLFRSCGLGGFVYPGVLYLLSNVHQHHQHSGIPNYKYTWCFTSGKWLSAHPSETTGQCPGEPLSTTPQWKSQCLPWRF